MDWLIIIAVVSSVLYIGLDQALKMSDRPDLNSDEFDRLSEPILAIMATLAGSAVLSSMALVAMAIWKNISK